MGVLRNWTRRSRWPMRIAFSLLLIALGSTADASAAVLDRVPRVLILYPYDERIAATTVAGETVRARLLEATGGKIDLFSEFLDLSRFPEAHHADRMALFLAEKYAARQPDVVIALGEQSAKFIATHRATLAKNAGSLQPVSTGRQPAE